MNFPYFDTDFLDYFPLRGGQIPSSTTKIRALPSFEDTNDRKDQIIQFDAMKEFTLRHKQAMIQEPWQVYRNEEQDYYWYMALYDHLRSIYPGIFLSKSCPGAFVKFFSEVQEDGILVTQREDGTNFVSHVFLSLPNDWGADQAIGKSFEEAHAHITRIKRIMPNPCRMFQMMLNARQPFERVGAVNFRVSPDLNRHITIPEIRRCRPFDLTNPSLWCRFERQVAMPVQAINSVLLTVKTYQFNCKHPDPEKREQIIAAIEDLNPKAHAYHFLAEQQKDILTWLKSKD